MAVQERNEERNKEKKKYGEKIAFDPGFKGPRSAKRSCTDVVFLFLFLVYIGIWIGVAIYVVYNGDLNKVIAPKSSFRSQLCGYDPAVKNKPYLMFFDLSKCFKPIPITGCNTPQVCVEKCPDKPFLWDTVNRSSFNPNDLICQANINTPKTIDEAQVRIENGECARYYLPSKAVLGRCLGSGRPFTSNEMHAITIIQNRFNLTAKSSQVVLDSIEREFTLSEYLIQTFTKVVEDLSNCWKELVIYTIVAFLLTLLVMFMLKWFAGIITWGCLIISIVLCTYGAYYCIKKYVKYAGDDLTGREQVAKSGWLGLFVTFVVAGALALILIIFLRKRIMLTIAIFEETSKSVLSNIMSLFFPLIPWILQLAVIVFSVYVALYIIAIVESEYRFFGSQSSCKCTGEASGYKEGSICSPKLFADLCKENDKACKTASCSPKHNVKYLHAVNIFGFLWVTFFLTAFGEMVLALTFATWYFTFNKDDVPYFGIFNALMITTRYHIGTLAFGSFIVAIIRGIRILMEYIDAKSREGGGSGGVVQLCLCLGKCCMYCLEELIRFINTNAYIMCAIHGTNFCTSAKNAFFLIMRNMLQIAVILQVTSFLIFVNIVIIAVIVMTLSYFISFSDTTAFHFNWFPIVIVGIISFLVAMVFFSVFSMGIDTLFICFLQDLERNDGSSQKPYYMSKNLMAVFNVENVD